MPVSDERFSECPATAAAGGTYPAVSTGVGAGVEAGTAGTGAAGTTGALGTTGLHSFTLVRASRFFTATGSQRIPQKCKKRKGLLDGIKIKWIQI